jgi:hypothetical protein
VAEEEIPLIELYFEDDRRWWFTTIAFASWSQQTISWKLVFCGKLILEKSPFSKKRFRNA